MLWICTGASETEDRAHMAAAGAEDDAQAQRVSYRRAGQDTCTNYTLCIVAHQQAVTLSKCLVAHFRQWRMCGTC